jgi:hypothetical protein
MFGKGQFVHVKGHQDNNKTNQKKINVKLNILADRVAGEALGGTTEYQKVNALMRISINKEYVFSIRKIQEHVSETIITKFWKGKFGISTYGHIDWELYKRIIKKFGHSMAIIKMMNSLTPTMVRMKKLNQVESDLCPICKEIPETIHDVIKCHQNPENIIQNSPNITPETKEKNNNNQKKEIINILLSESLEKILPLLESQKKIGSKDITKWIQEGIEIDIEEKNIIQFMFTIIHQWNKAWTYRNSNVKHGRTHYHESQQQQDNSV